jgi:hypothetical protein
MKWIGPLLLAISWLATARAIELPPQFSDNMVLQRNVKNRIWGKTEANPKFDVFVEFKSTLDNKPYSKWDHSGRLKSENWELDLPEIDNRVKAPGTLSIWKGPKRDSPLERITFTNVVLGDVWIVALPEGQGSTQPPAREQNALRALVLPNVGDLGKTVKPGTVSWVHPSVLQRFDVMAYQFGQGLFSAGRKTTPPFGLIVIRAEELARWAPIERSDPALTNLVKGTQQQATRVLRDQRKTNEQHLIEMKHRGEIGKVETIIRYDSFDVYTPSEKAGALNFKGAFAPAMKR